MKVFNSMAYCFVGLIALVLLASPTPAFSKGAMMGKEVNSTGVTCKSGKVVKNAKACKENGGNK